MSMLFFDISRMFVAFCSPEMRSVRGRLAFFHNATAAGSKSASQKLRCNRKTRNTMMAYAPGFLYVLKVPFWPHYQAGTLCLLDEGKGGRARRRHVCFPII